MVFRALARAYFFRLSLSALMVGKGILASLLRPSPNALFIIFRGDKRREWFSSNNFLLRLWIYICATFIRFIINNDEVLRLRFALFRITSPLGYSDNKQIYDSRLRASFFMLLLQSVLFAQ
jgi:hypothetical protein